MSITPQLPAVVVFFATAMATGLALAQDPETDAVLSVQSASLGTVNPPGAERLPAQPEDRGHLMPLHAASVMSWLCGDPSVQTALGRSRVECYRAVYPSVEACTAQLQEKAPAAQNRTAGGRMDVVSFRAAFRTCLQQDYAQRLAAQGIAAPQFTAGVPDPLAARMSGATAP